MSKTNVLLIGNGGREHAIAWKIAQSPLLGKLFIASGNAGTSMIGTNVAIDGSDFDKIGLFALQNKIGMVVVGPEDPLVRGIHDYFKADPELKDIIIIGPGKAGAQLEGSKDFAKQFMIKYGIPTARYSTFVKENIAEGFHFLDTLSPPYVLKADGLAAGKGVVICSSVDEAKSELSDMLTNQKFGIASRKVVIEEFLDGIELSAFAITNGREYMMLPEAKDYKRIGEDDTGLNTGGMGSVSPVAFADSAFMQKVKNRIVEPTIRGLQIEAIPYQGFIFFGLMNVQGDPYVIEYNVRLGDPETESILPRLKNDLLEIFIATAEGHLNDLVLEIDERTAVSVVMVSGGYPGDYEKGKEISGFDAIEKSLVFHAGSQYAEGKIVSAGGRVVVVTSLGESLNDAVNNSMNSAACISFENAYFRKDIGSDLQQWIDQHKK